MRIKDNKTIDKLSSNLFFWGLVSLPVEALLWSYSWSLYLFFGSILAMFAGLMLKEEVDGGYGD
jgi:hypothetical protein